ncbi:liver-expressed antimicrobial peptide 2 [Chanos chanos]|uniref:Liver-expressed antimicrobial peptide 2 n=1 Tax=Chanos chanos TaxID=29144 RepID=A0A6J2VXY0_CHACN|nr:liver-expressed antimicrobial peptide 2-like [Chanos chanos]
MQGLPRYRSLIACCLFMGLLIQQMASSPVSQLGGPSDAERGVQSSPKRVARMTPLWRIMGTKPFGAFCQNNYECSTGTCRKGHCSFSQPIKS